MVTLFLHFLHKYRIAEVILGKSQMALWTSSKLGGNIDMKIWNFGLSHPFKIIQTRWEHRHENLERWPFPFFQDKQNQFDIGFLVSSACNIAEPNICDIGVYSSTITLDDKWSVSPESKTYISRCKSQNSNESMSSCAKVSILKSIFTGSPRGCPGNAGFGFVIRKHMEEPSYAAIGNID